MESEFTKMKAHKEQRDNEYFVGNSKVGRDLSHLKNLNLRFGIQAIDIHGKKIPKDCYLPLFIGKESYKEYNNIMQNLWKVSLQK